MMRSPLPVLPRDDLFHYLGEAFDSHPLIVLSAAMGYGKTTLANDIKQRLGACCVSFTPAKAMADASAVWAALTECVSQASEEVAAIMKNMEVPDIRGELPPELVEAFRRESGKRALLILVDDYHLIDLPEISFFFEGLIKERISGVRVLLLTRRLPSQALTELVVKGLPRVFLRYSLSFSMLKT